MGGSAVERSASYTRINMSSSSVEPSRRQLESRQIASSEDFGLKLSLPVHHICDTRHLQKIPLGQIFQKKHTTIVYFIRRFGCYLTRAISSELNFALVPHLPGHCQFLVISSNNIGYEQFMNEGYLSNVPIANFYYADYSLFTQLQFRRYSGLQILVESLKPKTFKLTKTAMKSGITADLSGDIYQSGGLLIYQNGLLKHLQTSSRFRVYASQRYTQHRRSWLGAAPIAPLNSN